MNSRRKSLLRLSFRGYPNVVEMIGKKVLRYTILKQIGIGGYGEIYQAFDTKLERTVAVKFIRADKLRNGVNIERFASEARLAAILDHPNICAVFDYDYFEDTPFIVMQYLQGLTIRQAVNNRPLKINTALRIAVQLTDALAYAHAQGIAHRDVKPGNVMVTRTGMVKILDFAVAKRFGDAAWEADDLALTKSGEPYGTPTYAAPEQAQGEPSDYRADIFSAGALLYEMLAGRGAFDGRTADEVRRKVITEDAPSIAAKRGGFVPPQLENIVAHAMAKKADERYQSAAEMRDELIEVWRETAREDLTKETLLARIESEMLLPAQSPRLFKRTVSYIKKMLASGSSFPAIPKQNID
jgi:serine/threonine-protein kinase